MQSITHITLKPKNTRTCHEMREAIRLMVEDGFVIVSRDPVRLERGTQKWYVDGAMIKKA